MTRAARQRFVLATGNAGKLAEFRMLLDPTKLTLVSLAELGLTGPEETGATFVENALLKARHAAAATGLPAIAEDSGLLVAALNDAPGILSARFAGPGADDERNIDKLLAALAGRDEPDRSAVFVCVIVAVTGTADPAPVIAEGRWQGVIAAARAGTGGFGYDPVFIDPVTGLSAAELSPADKNARSHRGQAVAKLAAALTHRAGA